MVAQFRKYLKIRGIQCKLSALVGANYVYDGSQLEAANFTLLCGSSRDDSRNRVTSAHAFFDKYRSGSY